MSVQNQQLDDVELCPIHDTAVQGVVENPTNSEDSRTSLRKHLMEDPELRFFFQTSGMVHAQKSEWSFLQRLWDTVVLLGLLYSTGFGMFFFAYRIRHSMQDGDSLTSACTGLVVAVQSLLLVATTFRIAFRMDAPAVISDLPHFKRAVFYSRVVFYASLGLGAVTFTQMTCFKASGIHECTGIGWIPFLVPIQVLGHISGSCSLAVNCMFVQVDCFAAMAQILQLTEDQKQNLLTLERFNFCRADIRERVDGNYWTYTSLLFVGLMNLGLILLLFFAENANPLLCFAFIREVPFILVASYHAMTVNEKSDQLTESLGKFMYKPVCIE